MAEPSQNAGRLDSDRVEDTNKYAQVLQQAVARKRTRQDLDEERRMRPPFPNASPPTGPGETPQ